MKLVLICLFAFVLCTVHIDGVTATVDVTSTDSTTDDPTNDGATQATDVATQASDVATQATDGATETNATDASDDADTTTTSSSSETTTAQAFACYSCGSYNNMMAKCNSTEEKKDCSVKECWIYRNEENGTVTYARGCKSTDSKAKDFKCTDYNSEVCTTVGSATVCSQCCTDGKCNGGELTGSNSSEATTPSSSGLKCYSCGNYSNDTKATCKSTTETTDCPDTECWIYRHEKDETVTYARGCKSTDSKAKDLKCSDHKSEVCNTAGSVTLCAKCCEANECNDGELAGKKSSASTSFSSLFLAVAATTVVVSLTK